MRIKILGVVLLLSGCAPALQVVSNGKDAYGADLYVISGHPQLDDTTGARAAQYCASRGMDAHTEHSGADGPFTFSCRRKNDPIFH